MDAVSLVLRSCSESRIFSKPIVKVKFSAHEELESFERSWVSVP
ncbi:MAG: hypothetical protein ACLR5T_06200 [Veillonella sp.]